MVTTSKTSSTTKSQPRKALSSKSSSSKKSSTKKSALKKDSPNNVVTVNGRRRRPWALQTREKILAAATEEIAEVGFERARLTEIARRAGMTPGSVYTWFKNKEDLFKAALEDALEKQVESNFTVLERIGEVDKTNWLIQIASLVPRNADNPGPTPAQILLLEAYYASWRDPAARKKFLPRIEQHFALYERIITKAQADGHLAKDLDTQLLAMMFLAVPTGMSLLQFAGLPRPADEKWLPVYARLSTTFDK
jgi:AcrR family transcriptional regulator